MEARRQTVKQPRPARRFVRFSLRGLLVLVLICAGTIWLVIDWFRGQKAPLPPSVSISRLTASIESLAGNVDEFEVPEPFYEPILEELKVAVFDRKPKKWETLGHLDITYGDELTLEINLYSIYPELAYSLEGQPRRYYRGGDMVALEQLIREAHRSQKGK
jgi:hypothetical protein